jgi:hypothetical protein
LSLAADPWLITIDATREASKPRLTHDNDGFFITSCGHLERSDGKRFSRQEAADALDDLSYFLSFVAGWWVAWALPCGVDQASATWERWATTRVDRLAPGFGWFHPFRDGEAVNSAYVGYRRLRASPVWGDAITELVYWYVLARQTSDVLPALAIQQIGLEQLAWVYLIEDRRALSSKGRFDDLWASDKLRLLLTMLSIDASLPAHFTALATPIAGQKKFEDGPQAVTEIRNGAVHSSPKTLPLRKAYDAQIEAQTLSLWYLELALLKLLGYEGEYNNRVRGFKTERLP